MVWLFYSETTHHIHGSIGSGGSTKLVGIGSYTIKSINGTYYSSFQRWTVTCTQLCQEPNVKVDEIAIDIYGLHFSKTQL